MRFRDCLLYLRTMKHYMIASALVFALGVVLGYGFPGSFQSLLDEQIKQLQAIANEIDVSGHSRWFMFEVIFLNNLKVVLMVILLGAFFGVIPLFFLLANGLVLGYAASQSLSGNHLIDLLKGVLPHGFIEIPAFIIACAYGIRCGFLLFEGLWSWTSLRRRASFLIKMQLYLRQLFPLAVILIVMMLVAAAIESTVTVALMN